jgi:hypothetical protein
MPRPSPTPRPLPPQVAVQVARGGGPARPVGPVAARGRHRTPDADRQPVGRDAAPVPRAGAGPGGPSRHAAPTAVAQAAARRSAPGAMDRVDAARAAAAHPAVPAPRPRPTTAVPPDDDAVTELVAGPGRRGRPARPDGPGTGRGPGIVGLVLGLLALLGSVVVAAAPSGLGGLGTSPLALVVLLATSLLATACAGLGAGRHRRGRGVAVSGMVVGLAGVVAAVVPLLAL